MTLAQCAGDLPTLEVFVHPDHSLPERFPLEELRSICQPALGKVMAIARDASPLRGLEEIEVTLVSDAAIADVHVKFMSIEGATDVITFDYGEILISTDTAGTQGAENGNPIGRETALYLIHGLLHLAGYADKSESQFREMASLQAGILEGVWER